MCTALCTRKEKYKKPSILDIDKYPVTVVAVVGIGHTPGITKYWSEWNQLTDISELMM